MCAFSCSSSSVCMWLGPLMAFARTSGGRLRSSRSSSSGSTHLTRCVPPAAWKSEARSTGPSLKYARQQNWPFRGREGGRRWTHWTPPGWRPVLLTLLLITTEREPVRATSAVNRGVLGSRHSLLRRWRWGDHGPEARILERGPLTRGST